MTNALALPLAADRDPWARQPKERERAYVAFQDFLAMEPPRNVSKLAKDTRRPLSVVYQWSSRWQWLDRSIHYDGFLQRARDETLVEARREMNDRHAKLAKAMSGKVAERIGKLDAEELSPGEIGRWMQVISMVERLALGEATDITKREGAPDTVVNVTNEVTEVDALVVGPDYFTEVLARLRDAGAIDITALPGNGHAGNGAAAPVADGPPDEPVHPDQS